MDGIAGGWEIEGDHRERERIHKKAEGVGKVNASYKEPYAVLVFGFHQQLGSSYLTEPSETPTNQKMQRCIVDNCNSEWEDYPQYCNVHKNLYQARCVEFPCLHQIGGSKSKRQCSERQTVETFPFCFAHKAKATPYWKERGVARPLATIPYAEKDPIIPP